MGTLVKCAAIAVASLGITLTAVHAADEVKDPTGTWMWEYDYGQGPIDNVLVLTNKDGKLTGYYDNGDSKADITKGSFKDDKFNAEFTLELDGTEIQVKIEGEVTDDELEGVITADVGGEVGLLA